MTGHCSACGNTACLCAAIAAQPQIDVAALTITRRVTAGCYGDDADGNHWATFRLDNGPEVNCEGCSSAIRSGWFSTSTGEDRYWCLGCVAVENPPRAPKAGKREKA